LEDRARQCFAAEELAVVLSRYDLGVIESVTEFKRGSPLSPKVGIVCERGKFLLKKRAPNRSSARRVAFAHSIQSHLSKRGFPVAPLIKPRIGDARAARIGDDIYELFAFVAGQEYAATPGQTQDAGRVLLCSTNWLRIWTLLRICRVVVIMM